MSDNRLGLVEAHFAELIWSHEPISSGDLVKLSRTELGWQKSTTYTVLKKLCEKGYFQNEGGIVSSRISREQAQAAESRGYVADRFGGSLLECQIAASHRKRPLTRLVDKVKTIDLPTPLKPFCNPPPAIDKVIGVLWFVKHREVSALNATSWRTMQINNNLDTVFCCPWQNIAFKVVKLPIKPPIIVL